MPVRYRIDGELNVVVTTIEGTASAEELLQHAAALMGDPRAEGLDELVDLSEHETVPSSAVALRSMAAFVRDRKPKLARRKKLAVVAPSDAVFGMARIYAAHREDATIEAEVFRELEGALEWLGVAAADTENDHSRSG